ncbi:hypothetical protein PHLCEN_2v9559 [Hermanssonia centrifuga]|uniref:Arrestin-like N-terminal domain-containing protein n=1 Tax=Hermanssonia centrifuga TaxID=98765 RepID=A0A2R6NRC9_9APHY|nr:hypothetical protein PHLCEN_2v9559 [Hermanssonia centrifuga]
MVDFHVTFDPKPRVAGEVVEGEVLLNIPVLELRNYHEVHAECSCIVLTKIGNVKKSTTVFCSLAPIWKRSNLTKPSDEHITKVPFSFTLPSALLPTGKYIKKRSVGVVGYYIQVTGTRSGTLEANTHIFHYFPVLPSDARGFEISKSINEGWAGAWKTVEEKKSIRRYFWRRYATAVMTLSLPDLEFFPIATPTPFTLKIVTFTEPMQCKNPENGMNAISSLPDVPRDPRKEIEFNLVQTAFIDAGTKQTTITGHYGSKMFGFGAEADNLAKVETTQATWEPIKGDAKGRGTWKREVVFTSSFELFPFPSFQSTTLKVNVSGRSLIRNVPVCLHPGAVGDVYEGQVSWTRK